MTRIVIANAKGGSGKTTLAMNLAQALSQSGRSCHLVDADETLPQVSLFLEESNADETRATTSLEGDGEVPDSDFVLVDTGPGMTGRHLNQFQSSAMTLLVTEASSASLLGAMKTARAVRDCGAKCLLGVLVRCQSADVAERVAAILRSNIARHLSADSSFLGWIPEEPCVSKAFFERRLCQVSSPKSRFSREVAEIAERLVNWAPTDISLVVLPALREAPAVAEAA